MIERLQHNQLDPLADSGDAIGDLISCIEGLQVFLRLQQSLAVSTVDTIVYEHDTQELPIGSQSFTLTLQPQTRQMEQIDTVFCAIVAPAVNQQSITTAPTVTLDNAYAQLDSVYVNLNAIVNSSGGSGGAIPTPLGILLNSDSTRTFNIHATAPFVAGLFMTAVLVGRTIPATLGEANV